MVILGISIGTRSSGIAILEGNQLKVWNTISFKASWSEEKGDTIIAHYEQYIKKHNVKIVIVKIPRISHHTDGIVNLLQKVQKMITYHGCMVDYRSQAEIKEALPRIRNKRDVINYTATLYPVLANHQQRELTNRNKYHLRMFEAVLVAHLALQEKFPD
ncbi:hypothetical protein HDF24_07370 [Mucilaginibacter sp. X4EP1]|uniref:hypothetical protein n=1 Tax=Mucilaginibacter sp. X4EP1 TaxID=2723092 RepID=UPI00216A882D|nr:hypothetical protein [Mucilaginibacter sp. X4EP1]MCS3814130.1 RNase H-fold protein (predicted Holliday junction resolvase) [Mucilaginibacter sp. X4EP1]